MQSVYYFSVCFFLFSHVFPSSHGKLTEKIEKIQSEQKALASVIIEEERYRSRIRTAVQQLEVQIERGKLTKEIIGTMIDTVYVYDKKRIEVILRFDDVLQKVISEYMEGAKGA